MSYNNLCVALELFLTQHSKTSVHKEIKMRIKITNMQKSPINNTIILKLVHFIAIRKKSTRIIIIGVKFNRNGLTTTRRIYYIHLSIL